VHEKLLGIQNEEQIWGALILGCRGYTISWHQLSPELAAFKCTWTHIATQLVPLSTTHPAHAMHAMHRKSVSKSIELAITQKVW
jgi:hypothetical protein